MLTKVSICTVCKILKKKLERKTCNLNPILTRGKGGEHKLPPAFPPLGLLVTNFDWVIQFYRSLLTFTKIYMEWIFQNIFFSIARIYDPGTNFLTDGRIKILPDFKFTHINMYYISLDCKLFGDNKYSNYRPYRPYCAQKLII